MSTKSVFFLAGVVLLVAGCSNGLTSPRTERSGGASASAKAPPKAPLPTTTTPPWSALGEPECRSGYVVFSGRTDSVCLDDIQ